MPSNPDSRRDFLTGQVVFRAVRRAREAVERHWSEATPEARTYLLEIARSAMACDFQIYLNAGEQDVAAEQAVEALQVVEQLEAQLSVFRPTSEISLLNERAAIAPVTLEPRLFGLLCEARELSVLTNGAFDVTAGPLSKVWGFFRRQGRIPTEAELHSARECVGWQKLLFNEENHSVAFARPGMEINLGAIGKGYALDRCAEQLARAGVENFLMHGGQSSVLARGQRSGRDGWTVALRHPSRPEWRLGEIQLRNEALGTSGSANQFFHFQGRRLGHVIDPRTGWPAQQLLSATVIAPTAAEADALSTAFFVLGGEGSRAICAQRTDLAAILVAAGTREGSLVIETYGLRSADQWQLDPEWKAQPANSAVPPGSAQEPSSS